jgi:hypothetical protein
MTTDFAVARHRLLALALMECYLRYCRTMQQHPEAMPRVVAFYLGDHGIGHPSPVPAARPPLLILYIDPHYTLNAPPPTPR